MEQEKEVRYQLAENVWSKVLENTSPLIQKTHVLDITCGAFGSESLAKTGKVFRIRQKPTKIALEIKKRIGECDWLEEAIELKSVNQGLRFLHLAGLDPYLYIDREREVKEYKGLKIFFDDIQLLGKFIEIEYQDSKDARNELDEFTKKFGITGKPEPLYGEIINKKLNSDADFNDKFTKRLKEIVEEAKKDF